ncbi:MAG TPA: heavy metal-associated domain-containing protein [Tepidisphaeraceae bacterium]|nr:heavy metal-associated domain-containing protein [Tepidisphaeraceae bacterium]
MAQDVAADQLAVVRVEGMHCHRCEMAIQKKLAQISGVHEAEVDFNSGQASILFDRSLTSISDLIQAISDAGYSATPVNS